MPILVIDNGGSELKAAYNPTLSIPETTRHSLEGEVEAVGVVEKLTTATVRTTTTTAGEWRSVVLPNAVGAIRSSYVGPISSSSGGPSASGGVTRLVGDEILGLKQYHGLVVRRPLQQGLLVDAGLQAAIWERLFIVLRMAHSLEGTAENPITVMNKGGGASAKKNASASSGGDIDLVLTVPFGTPGEVAALWEWLCFRRFRFRSLLLISATFGTLYDPCLSPGPRTGNGSRTRSCAQVYPPTAAATGGGSAFHQSTMSRVIVDSGFSHTTVVPYANGFPVYGAIQRLSGLGGRLLTNQLKDLVSFTQINVLEDTWLVNRMKEAMLVVPHRSAVSPPDVVTCNGGTGANRKESRTSFEEGEESAGSLYSVLRQCPRPFQHCRSDWVNTTSGTNEGISGLGGGEDGLIEEDLNDAVCTVSRYQGAATVLRADGGDDGGDYALAAARVKKQHESAKILMSQDRLPSSYLVLPTSAETTPLGVLIPPTPPSAASPLPGDENQQKKKKANKKKIQTSRQKRDRSPAVNDTGESDGSHEGDETGDNHRHKNTRDDDSSEDEDEDFLGRGATFHRDLQQESVLQRWKDKQQHCEMSGEQQAVLDGGGMPMLRLCKELYVVAEVMFQPHLVGSVGMGLSEAVLRSIALVGADLVRHPSPATTVAPTVTLVMPTVKKAAVKMEDHDDNDASPATVLSSSSTVTSALNPEEQRLLLAQRSQVHRLFTQEVTVVGGTSQLTGLHARLQSDLQQAVPQDDKAHTTTASLRVFPTPPMPTGSRRGEIKLENVTPPLLAGRVGGGGVGSSPEQPLQLSTAVDSSLRGAIALITKLSTATSSGKPVGQQHKDGASCLWQKHQRHLLGQQLVWNAASHIPPPPATISANSGEKSLMGSSLSKQKQTSLTQTEWVAHACSQIL